MKIQAEARNSVYCGNSKTYIGKKTSNDTMLYAVKLYIYFKCNINITIFINI